MRYYSSVAQPTSLSSGLAAVAPGAADTFTSTATPTGYPTQYPFTIAINEGLTDEELCDVNDISGTTWSVTRGVDGSTPVAHTAGATITHVSSARDFGDPQSHIAATTGVHGITGSVVGTTDAQTLTNKTIDGGANTFQNVPTSAITGTAVTLSAAQTLTNKTISSASNTLTIDGTKATLSNIPESAVTNLTSDLAAKASQSGDNTFSGANLLTGSLTTANPRVSAVHINGDSVYFYGPSITGDTGGVLPARLRAATSVDNLSDAYAYSTATLSAAAPAGVTAGAVTVGYTSAKSGGYVETSGLLTTNDGLQVGSGGSVASALTRGRYTGTTDGTGQLTIAHGLGATPTSVKLTVEEGWGGTCSAKLVSFDATNLHVRITSDVDGTNKANATGGAVHWEAVA